MSIDEAIEKESKIAKENQKIVDTQIVFDNVSISELYCDDTEVIEEHLSNYKKCAEYHEQIAEWLEELKVYQQHEIICNKGYNSGYNKAIDDFAEKLNTKCDGMIKEKWNSNVAPMSWAEAYADFKDDIEETAEQLRGRE